MSWIVCQIGARENFAVARALHRQGLLKVLVTDAWVAPTNPLRSLLGRIGERSHAELAGKVWAPTCRAVLRELADRRAKSAGWQQILHRNAWFQRVAVQRLARLRSDDPLTVFAYSYAAAEVFAFAKKLGWRTVLGQIDPGPAEARMVDELYAKAGQPRETIPAEYWDSWRRETDLADAIVVNSDWSARGLAEEGVKAEKISVIPLACETRLTREPWSVPARFEPERPLRLLFLGQVTLRKGIDLVLEALRNLPGQPLQLDVVGPVQIEVPDWTKQDGRIRFRGSVPRSAVAEAYANTDIFLFPTRSDGFGLTQLEAQAAGVPVIASTRCGTVVEHGTNGFLLEDLDAKALAELLQCLVENPSLVAKLRQGARLDPRYGVDRLGETLIALGETLREAARCMI